MAENENRPKIDVDLEAALGRAKQHQSPWSKEEQDMFMRVEGESELADVEKRIALLRDCRRPGPLSTSEGTTADGHISSALTKLERRRDELRRRR